jgi:hypothetical protein
MMSVSGLKRLQYRRDADRHDERAAHLEKLALHFDRTGNAVASIYLRRVAAAKRKDAEQLRKQSTWHS